MEISRDLEISRVLNIEQPLEFSRGPGNFQVLEISRPPGKFQDPGYFQATWKIPGSWIFPDPLKNSRGVLNSGQTRCAQ